MPLPEKLVIRQVAWSTAEEFETVCEVQRSAVPPGTAALRAFLFLSYDILRANDGSPAGSLLGRHEVPRDGSGPILVTPVVADPWPQAFPWKFRFRLSAELKWLLPTGDYVTRATATKSGMFQIGGSLVPSPSSLNMLLGAQRGYLVTLGFPAGIYGDVTSDPETVATLPPDGVAELVAQALVRGVAQGVTTLTLTHGPASARLPIQVS